MAAQGLRDMGDGHEKIADREMAEELRARGTFINRAVLGSTAVSVALVVLARVA